MRAVYKSESLQSGDSRHILVKQNQGIRLVFERIQRIAPVGYGCHFISLGFKKKYVGLEKIYLVVSPEYFVCHIANRCRDSELFLVLEEVWVPAGRREPEALPRSGSILRKNVPR